MPDYDDDKYVDLSPQLQENDEYVDLSPQLKASDEYVNLSPFKKEGGASRPASDANQYQNFSPAREESEYQVLHVPREGEPYQVLHVPREDEPYQVFDMKTNKMIELNKYKPDSMIELNKHKPDSMIELNKAQESLVSNRSVNYYPTHFLPSEPLRPYFFGKDEKFNSTEARRNLRAQLKQSLGTMHRMPDMGAMGTNGRGLYIADAPSDDFIRYYFELHDPKVYDYDLLRVTDGDLSAIEASAAREEAYSSAYEYGDSTRHRARDNTTEMYSSGTTRFIEGLYCPDWYRGFTNTSFIKYKPLDGGSGSIRFYGQDPLTGEDSIIIRDDFSYKKNEWNNKYLSIKTGSDQWQKDIVHVTPLGNKFGHHMVTDDFFNKIKLYSPHKDIRLKNIQVVYNGEFVCDTKLLKQDGRMQDRNFVIEQGTPYTLAALLRLTKHRAIGYSDNEVLKTAAQELGRAWCFKWRRVWTRGWCGAFTNWLLDKSTSLRSLPNWDSKYDYLFFDRNDRLINEAAGYRFGDIYSLVEPGDKIRMTSPGIDIKKGDYIHHTTSFIEWESWGHNSAKFRAIGGNQGRRVNVATFTALNQRPMEPDLSGEREFYHVLQALYFKNRDNESFNDYFASVGPPYFMRQPKRGIYRW